MTPEELSSLGKRLYGKRWIRPMATDLGRHYMTVWKWSSGKLTVPVNDAKLLILKDTMGKGHD